LSDREYFRFLAYCWDVTAAQEIAAELPVGRFDPRPWFGWLEAIGVDEDHLSTVDLERPIIVVRIREADGNPMIIDGWHRIARAQREDVRELPVVLLDQDREYRVRIVGGDKQGGDDSAMTSYTHRQVSDAVTAGVDLVHDELDLGERDQDLLNLAVNAIMTQLADASADLDDVIRENYNDDSVDVRQWWDW
jgi:hypothetical protein